MLLTGNITNIFTMMIQCKKSIRHWMTFLMTLKANLLWQNTLNPEEHYLAVRKQSSHLNLSSDRYQACHGPKQHLMDWWLKHTALVTWKLFKIYKWLLLLIMNVCIQIILLFHFRFILYWNWQEVFIHNVYLLTTWPFRNM